MIPSKRQETLYNIWETTGANLLIQAVAGSGKTTTLMGIVERCKFRTLFLAFNKSIQEEISAKIEANGFTHAKALTLHSLGLSAIKYKFKNEMIVKTSKNYDLIKSLQSYNKRLFHKFSWEERAKITLTLMEMNDISRIYLEERSEEIFKIMTKMDKYYLEADNIKDLWAEFLYIREESYKGKIIIDFIDMIYVPVKFKLLIPVQPYYLLIDEAQDLNLVQHHFIEQIIEQGDVNKWVAVGDRRQAIYGFSGSYASSFDIFKNKDNVIELPLDVCYRCPALIVEEANKVYNVMEGFKTEPGIVESIQEEEFIKRGSMVICRNNYPLIKLYFTLLSLGRKVYIKGEDVAGTVNRFLKPYSYKSIAQTKTSLKGALDELASLTGKTQEQMFKMYKLKENVKIFNILAKNYPNKKDKVGELLSTFDVIFKEVAEEEAITLCTIHKSKGLEADVVYILNEDLIPSKFAVSSSQLEQEENLRYVARTRAKKEMYYLDLVDTEDY